MTTAPEALERISTALFGSWAPGRLADVLGVSERSVRRWRDDPVKYRVPPGVWNDLAAECERRFQFLPELVEAIKQFQTR